MNIASVAIKRPVFISSIVILLLTFGFISAKRIGVDLYPDVTEPILIITTSYPGAAPEEIENLISKPLEEEISTVAGLKRLTSRNQEGVSVIISEFNLDTDIKYVQQQVVELVSKARYKLPTDAESPKIQSYNTSGIPVLRLAIIANLPAGELYDLANEQIKPLIEQVNDVGTVTILGGTKREIQVELDRKKLNDLGIPAITVAQQLQSAGSNIPAGKYEQGARETVFRTIGIFNSVDQIRETVVSFSGDISNSISLKDLAVVRDGVQDTTNMAFLYYPVKNGKSQSDTIREQKQCLFLDVYKQSKANTVAVSDNVKKKIEKVNDLIKKRDGSPSMFMVYDNAKWIRSNISDVKFTMILGIILAIVVVYLFLGNIRSTLITGIAIPNSILGAFVLMYSMDFTVNMLTLLALSLSVGLLVDDAIVVRENIFRKLESGMKPFQAAEIGTKQVMLAVIATTLTIIAVFLPIGFLQGIVGRYFKQFGLTVVFAMAISLFDALTVAPFLSAYFAGKGGKAKNFLVTSFDKFQTKLENIYARVIRFSLDRPVVAILVTLVIFFGSVGAFFVVKKTFMPENEEGEFTLMIEMPPGTSITGTHEVIKKIESKLKTMPDLNIMATVVGNEQGESNIASIGIFMLPSSERKRNVDAIKTEIRTFVREFEYARPSVNNFELSGGGVWKPFILNITGDDMDELDKYTTKLIEKMKKIPDLTEVDTSYSGGRPEFQIKLDPKKMQILGVNSNMAGSELRYHIAGGVVGKLHKKNMEYDIRLRLKSDQRNLRSAYRETKIPNMQYKMIPLSAIATGGEASGPSRILRQDRARVVQITANITPGGAIGSATELTKQLLDRDLPLPKNMSYNFWGESEALSDLIENILLAFFLSILFIYLVLASLYESFITPVTILLAIPPALSGAFFALFITGEMFNIFSMIGIIMLMGLVTKNSILLVDFAVDGVRSGMSRKEAIYNAGMMRLRPILMTTFAMLAGTLPVAIGLGDGAKMRSSMGIAIIGGIIISTVITLVVVPAVFEYIDIFRDRLEGLFRPGESDREIVNAKRKKKLS